MTNGLATTAAGGGFGPGFGAGFAGGGYKPTMGTMVFRIAAELGARFDLAGAPGTATQQRPNAEAIRNAINTAISVYQKQRFRFNELDPANPIVFDTIAGQSTYSTNECPALATSYSLDYLNIRIGNTLMQLSQVTPERQHLNIQLFTQFGLPTSYAYEGNTVILYPVPVAAYEVRVGAHLQIPGPVDDNETDNVWMTQAERLIRSRAKYEVAVHVTRNMPMAQAMSPEPGSAGEAHRSYQELKQEGNKITSTRSRVKPMAW
jgi:hypothetical protein